MSKEELTYEQAMQRLEEITESFEPDQISSRLAEAQKLISFCQKRIQQVEQDIQTILKDEQE